VSTTDSNGCESEAELTEVIVGLSQFAVSSLQFVIFPNPVKDKFTIQKLQVTSGTAADVSIYNVMGEKIISGLESTGSTTVIDVGVLPCGLYYLELSTSEKTLRTKFIKE
jgi:hypothetical protein